MNNVDCPITEMVWKSQGGVETPLVEMSYDALQRAYYHASDMLYNTNLYSPGKYIARENIKKMRIACNAELCMRYLLHEAEPMNFTTTQEILKAISFMKTNKQLTNTDTVDKIFTNLPTEFNSVTINDLMDACFDKLGIVNRKMISDKFILAQGIWLTKEEKEDLSETDEKGNRRSFMDVIKERLILNNVHLRVDPKGLSYNEFKSLVKLDTMTKISDVPSATLQLLRDKILLLLDTDVQYHINKWLEIIDNLKKAADYKHFILKEREY